MIKQQIKQDVQQHTDRSYLNNYKAHLQQKISGLQQKLLRVGKITKQREPKVRTTKDKIQKNYIEANQINEEFTINRRERIKIFYQKLKIETPLFENRNKSEGILKDGERIQLKNLSADNAKIFISKVQFNNPLSRIDQLIYQDDWMRCKIYKKKHGEIIVLLDYQTFDIFEIEIWKIEMRSIEIFENVIKLSTVEPLSKENKQCHYIFKFRESKNAWVWKKYFQFIHEKSTSLYLKWESTSVKCLQKAQRKNNSQYQMNSRQSKKMKEKEELKNLSQINKINNIKGLSQRANIIPSIQFNFQYKQNSKLLQSRKLRRERENKYEIPTDIDNSKTKQTFNLQPNVELQEKEPENFNQLQLPSRAVEQNYVSDQFQLKTIDPVESPSLSGMPISQKLIQKIEEKSKLLAEISGKKLNIHWFEQSAQNKIEEFENDISSPSRYISSPTKDFRQKKSSLNSQKTVQHNFQSPPSIKRVDSINCGSENYTEMDFKKSQFSIQPERVLQTSGKRKRQEQTHYLQKLRQKQQRKERSKRSRENSQNKKNQYLLNAQQEGRKSLKSIVSKYHENSIMAEESFSQQIKTQSNQEIAIQQLKNGIVLQKWYKKDTKPKIKKLYLSSTTSELCYSELDNKDQKKYLLKNVTMIQYGKITQGIAKHRKKGIQQLRCLRIDVNDNGKDKLLQFYLPSSEPQRNLEHFSEKLCQFVRSHNQFVQ